MRHLLLPAVALLAFGCPTETPTEGFAGGEFAFQTVGVTDGCFDGGFDVIFMPEGPDTPNDFGEPIYVPSFEELPATYTIPLQDPFSDFEAEVTGTETTRQISGATNTDVELDPDDYPGCLVDMTFDVSLTIVDENTVQGTAVLGTSSFDEDGCPVVTSDPCDITLDIEGTRVSTN